MFESISSFEWQLAIRNGKSGDARILSVVFFVEWEVLMEIGDEWFVHMNDAVSKVKVIQEEPSC